MLLTAAALLTLALLTGALFSPAQLPELLLSLRPQLAFALLITGGLLILEHRFASGAAAIAVAALALISVGRHYRAAPAPLADPQLTVVHMNLLNRQAVLDRVAGWAKKQQADILVTAENADGTLAAPIGWLELGPEEGCMPNRVRAYVRSTGFTCRALDTNGRKQIILSAEEEVVHIQSVHTVAPFLPAGTARRREDLRFAAQIARPTTVLLGDLNLVPWSKDTRQLSQRGFRRVPTGRQATWACPLPLIGLPIDHVWVRGEVPVSAELGPWLGSDHRPVLVRIGAAASSNRSSEPLHNRMES
ncbi:endonuclease/exonuclease/phosphatase family protein [Parvularcula maris]|uniref:Endonuclease/exonuclease/phosphatase family protein n=1 Tax=Parvularcula maris TaxID=2965077 RepID=A0A9X2RJM5_9PROT|nr:endonuclease/exonuclease/phosphatase family protein [Parvularcula maris]MCQ8184893.1 endonuclease/exonuclease/phosphatase family protein [Parvularcula maris]